MNAGTIVQTIVERPPILRLRPGSFRNHFNPTANGGALSGDAEAVAEVARSIQNVRRNFTLVSEALVRFDGAQFRDVNGSVLALSQEWNQLKQQFDDCVKLSLAKADDAVIVIESIASVLDEAAEVPLENDMERIQQFLTEIKVFSMALEDGEPGISDVHALFRELADQVQLFKSKITIALQSADAALKAELAAAIGPLPQLQRELDELRSKDSRCCSSSDKRRARELHDDITQRARRRDVAQEQLRRLQGHRAELEERIPHTEDTAQQIYILTDIWLAILVQTKDLLGFMKLNFGSGSTLAFRRKLEHLKSKYADYAEVLNMYIEQANLAAI